MMANYWFAAFLKYCLILIFVLLYTLNENVTSAVHKEENITNSNPSARNFSTPIVKKKVFKYPPMEIVAMDVKIVGIGYLGQYSIVARVSIVNSKGVVIYDKYVKPFQEVTDYRYPMSGIRPGDLDNGEIYNTVRCEVRNILKHKILVGHDVQQDLHKLKLKHNIFSIRNTVTYPKFKAYGKGRLPSLKLLSDKFFGHNPAVERVSSVEDARTVLKMYLKEKIDWDFFVKQEIMKFKEDRRKAIREFNMRKKNQTITNQTRTSDVE